MKKSRLFIVSSLAILLGVGAFGAFKAAANQAEPEEVEAAGSSVTLYINHFDAGSDKGGVWSNFKYYLFGSGGNNGWPGVSFTDSMKTSTPNEYDQYQYVLTVDTSKYQSLVLTGNSDSTWGGSFAKTEDFSLTDISSTNNGLTCGTHKGWQTDANVFGINTFGYSTKTVYMLDLRGNIYDEKHYCHTFATGKSGTKWPGVEMSKVSGQNNLYSVEINSVLNNVIFDNKPDDWETGAPNQTSTITGVSDGDAYVVYPDNGYNKLTSDAAKYIDKYMKFETKWLDDEGTGQCKSAGWYSSAKSAFSGKTADQKSDILAHEPTSYRLAAWARANGETFNTSTGVFSAPIRIVDTVISSSSGTIAIIVVSAISIAAVGGYFLFRKKKEN